MGDRVIAPHHGPEITGGGEHVVKAAVGDQEGLAMADLAIDHAGQIDAGLADQPPAELKRELRISEDRRSARQGLVQWPADGGDIERPIASKIGNAEAAAEA